MYLCLWLRLFIHPWSYDSLQQIYRQEDILRQTPLKLSIKTPLRISVLLLYTVIVCVCVCVCVSTRVHLSAVDKKWWLYWSVFYLHFVRVTERFSSITCLNWIPGQCISLSAGGYIQVPPLPQLTTTRNPRTVIIDCNCLYPFFIFSQQCLR